MAHAIAQDEWMAPLAHTTTTKMLTVQRTIVMMVFGVNGSRQSAEMEHVAHRLTHCALLHQQRHALEPA